MFNMFKNIKVYGPYLRKDGHKHVIIVTKSEDGQIVDRQTMSYPKFVVEGILLTELDANLTIDHIDNDYTNDSPGNLQALQRRVREAFGDYVDPTITVEKKKHYNRIRRAANPGFRRRQSDGAPGRLRVAIGLSSRCPRSRRRRALQSGRQAHLLGDYGRL